MSDFLSALNRHTEREEARLDAIFAKLAEIASVQAEQAAILDEHIRRTEANEQAVEALRVRSRVLEDGNLAWATLGKAAAGAVTVAGAVVAVLKFLGVV